MVGLGGCSDSRSKNSMVSTWFNIASQSVVSMRDDSEHDSREALRAIFEQEVNVWFGLSHPHVVRLFGACHVGTPFFACEYAGGGSLDKYLLKHPEEMWTKLFQAALGVQYLQSRNILHGDLKCNNIMVGNDGKAKVTDFGLSSFEEETSDEGKLSGAWQWVAPECIKHGASKLSFASDVYSLGMCIVEALRVAECAKLGATDNEGAPPLPWGNFDNATVKYYVVTRQKLPQRPKICTDEQWKLVERMCAHDPADRFSIMTVVDELRALAQGDASCEPESELPETKSSLSKVIAEMGSVRQKLHQDATSRDRKVLCKIYELLWSRLAQLAPSTCENDAGNVAAIKSLKSLIERARESMLVLEKHNETLVAFTEIALRGYALRRELDKVIEAKKWRTNEEDRQWRDRCWELLTAHSSDEANLERGRVN